MCFFEMYNHDDSGWPDRFVSKYLDTGIVNESFHDSSMNLALPDGALLDKPALRMERTSYSTAFSGIDSPGKAFAQLRCAASVKQGEAIAAPKHIHAVAS